MSGTVTAIKMSAAVMITINTVQGQASSGLWGTMNTLQMVSYFLLMGVQYSQMYKKMINIAIEGSNF